MEWMRRLIEHARETSEDVYLRNLDDDHDYSLECWFGKIVESEQAVQDCFMQADMNGQNGFRYEQVVPWGRSLDEYRQMFSLTDGDLQSRILGCADGPASFNVEMLKRGNPVVSCDPLYRLTADQIKIRIDATYQDVMEQLRENRSQFVWHTIRSPEELGQIRMRAMLAFLEDYDQGKRDGRYLDAQLPSLPIPSSSFDLALCSHFLFLYSDNLSFSFHYRSIEEMCRVAKEVRVFPILDYNGNESPYVARIFETLQNAGFKVSIVKVPYEFQRGGDRMITVTQ